MKRDRADGADGQDAANPMPTILLPTGGPLAQGTGEQRMAFLFKERPICEAIVRALHAGMPREYDPWGSVLRWATTLWVLVSMFGRAPASSLWDVMQELDWTPWYEFRKIVGVSPWQKIVNKRDAVELAFFLRCCRELPVGDVARDPAGMRNASAVQQLYDWANGRQSESGEPCAPLGKGLFCTALDELDERGVWASPRLDYLRPEEAVTAWLNIAIGANGTIFLAPAQEWAISWHYHRAGTSPAGALASLRDACKYRSHDTLAWNYCVAVFIRACNSVWPCIADPAAAQRTYGAPAGVN